MSKRKGKSDNRFTFIVAAVLVVGVGMILLLSMMSRGQEPAVDPAAIGAGGINTATGIAIGAEDAPVTIAEWSDYQCPYCARQSTDTFPLLKEKYIDTGQVRYIAKDYPLAGHPQANTVAEYVNCAVDQGGYWELRDLVFARQGEWSGQRNFLDRIRGYADEVGLDTDAMQSCFRAATMREQIQVTKREGTQLGITGTPTMFVNGVPISGAVPWEQLDAMLTDMLTGNAPDADNSDGA